MTEDTRKAIVEATLALVGESGFQGLTVRAIAERAKVAVSAVNYHFGSKDKALAEAFQYVTDELKAAFAPLRETKMAPRKRLEAFVEGFAEAVHRHGQALAFFTASLGPGREAPESYRAFAEGEGLDLVRAALAELKPGISRVEVSIRLAQLAGALLYPEIVEGALGLDFQDRSIRKAYAKRAAAGLIGQS